MAVAVRRAGRAPIKATPAPFPIPPPRFGCTHVKSHLGTGIRPYLLNDVMDEAPPPPPGTLSNIIAKGQYKLLVSEFATLIQLLVLMYNDPTFMLPTLVIFLGAAPGEHFPRLFRELALRYPAQFSLLRFLFVDPNPTWSIPGLQEILHADLGDRRALHPFSVYKGCFGKVHATQFTMNHIHSYLNAYPGHPVDPKHFMALDDGTVRPISRVFIFNDIFDRSAADPHSHANQVSEDLAILASRSNYPHISRSCELSLKYFLTDSDKLIDLHCQIQPFLKPRSREVRLLTSDAYGVRYCLGLPASALLRKLNYYNQFLRCNRSMSRCAECIAAAQFTNYPLDLSQANTVLDLSPSAPLKSFVIPFNCTPVTERDLATLFKIPSFIIKDAPHAHGDAASIRLVMYHLMIRNLAVKTPYSTFEYPVYLDFGGGNRTVYGAEKRVCFTDSDRERARAAFFKKPFCFCSLKKVCPHCQPCTALVSQDRLYSLDFQETVAKWMANVSNRSKTVLHTFMVVDQGISTNWPVSSSLNHISCVNDEVIFRVLGNEEAYEHVNYEIKPIREYPYRGSQRVQIFEKVQHCYKLNGVTLYVVEWSFDKILKARSEDTGVSSIIDASKGIIVQRDSAYYLTRVVTSTNPLAEIRIPGRWIDVARNVNPPAGNDDRAMVNYARSICNNLISHNNDPTTPPHSRIPTDNITEIGAMLALYLATSYNAGLANLLVGMHEDDNSLIVKEMLSKGSPARIGAQTLMKESSPILPFLMWMCILLSCYGVTYILDYSYEFYLVEAFVVALATFMFWPSRESVDDKVLEEFIRNGASRLAAPMAPKRSSIRTHRDSWFRRTFPFLFLFSFFGFSSATKLDDCIRICSQAATPLQRRECHRTLCPESATFIQFVTSICIALVVFFMIVTIIAIISSTCAFWLTYLKRYGVFGPIRHPLHFIECCFSYVVATVALVLSWNLGSIMILVRALFKICSFPFVFIYRIFCRVMRALLSIISRIYRILYWTVSSVYHFLAFRWFKLYLLRRANRNKSSARIMTEGLVTLFVDEPEFRPVRSAMLDPNEVSCHMVVLAHASRGSLWVDPTELTTDMTDLMNQMTQIAHADGVPNRNKQKAVLPLLLQFIQIPGHPLNFSYYAIFFYQILGAQGFDGSIDNGWSALCFVVLACFMLAYFLWPKTVSYEEHKLNILPRSCIDASHIAQLSEPLSEYAKAKITCKTEGASFHTCSDEATPKTGICQIYWTFPDLLPPKAFHKCPLVECHALRCRQLKNLPYPEPKLLSTFSSFTRVFNTALIDQIMIDFRVASFDEWIVHYPGSKKKAILRSKEACESEYLTKNIIYSGFPKTDEKVCDSTEKLPRPRWVSGPSTWYKIVTGPFFYSLSYRLEQVLPGYCVSKNFCELGNWYSKAISSIPNPVVFCGDGSAFDSTQHREILEVADVEFYNSLIDVVDLVDSLVCESEIRRYVSWIDHRGYGKWHAYTLSGTQPSGKSNTTEGNTRRTVLYYAFICFAAGILKFVKMLAKGDDVILILEKRHIKVFEAHRRQFYTVEKEGAHGLGQVMREGFFYEPECADFVSARFMPVSDTEFVCIRQPERAMQMDSWTTTNLKSVSDVRKHLWSVGMCGLEWSRGVPIFGAWYQSMVRNGAVDPKFAEKQERLAWEGKNRFNNHTIITEHSRSWFAIHYNISVAEQEAIELYFNNLTFSCTECLPILGENFVKPDFAGVDCLSLSVPSVNLRSAVERKLRDPNVVHTLTRFFESSRDF